VDEACAVEVFVALENLQEQSSCRFLSEAAALSNEFGEVSTGAVLSDDVAVVQRAEGMLIAKQTGMAGLFEALYFVVQHGVRGGVSQGFELDHFDGYFCA